MCSGFDGFRSFYLLIISAVAAVLVSGCGVSDHGDVAYTGGANGVTPAEEGDRHNEFEENPFVDTGEENTSTFGMDVSTASYTLMRRDLEHGNLPNPVGVRTEEYVNFFDYDYPEPEDDDLFSLNLEAAPSHFGSTEETQRHLLRLGVRARDVSLEEMNPTNLVFLIDTSGSMSGELSQVQQSLHVLLEHLRDTDKVGIQTYAGSSQVLWESTELGGNRDEIAGAIDSLESGGSTYGEAGIVEAYDMAEDAFIEGGNNRVVILTDGNFNVGKTGDDLVDLVKSYRERDISLTSVAYGMGFNDGTMERLAREGNGNYFYVDSQQEAERIFGTDLPSTVQVVAHDARTQVEFNSEVVDRYRLVGYEKRVMDNEDFDDEDADAGEVGAGHTVTAFYEMELHEDFDADSDAVAELRVNHAETYGGELNLQARKITPDDILADFEDASADFRFAAAVVQYAEILGESQHVVDEDFDEILEVADAASDEDNATRQEFLELAEQAGQLW